MMSRKMKMRRMTTSNRGERGRVMIDEHSGKPRLTIDNWETITGFFTGISSYDCSLSVICFL